MGEQILEQAYHYEFEDKRVFFLIDSKSFYASTVDNFW